MNITPMVVYGVTFIKINEVHYVEKCAILFEIWDPLFWGRWPIVSELGPIRLTQCTSQDPSTQMLGNNTEYCTSSVFCRKCQKITWNPPFFTWKIQGLTPGALNKNLEKTSTDILVSYWEGNFVNGGVLLLQGVWNWVLSMFLPQCTWNHIFSKFIHC